MTSKTKKQPPLCGKCIIVRDEPIIRPTYLVHPVTGELMLFDVRSEAVCPDCGARYRRTLNDITLIAEL
jgi:predicted RNA-binding Zn-ribbon protein involved in translation (DUF1610 family)